MECRQGERNIAPLAAPSLKNMSKGPGFATHTSFEFVLFRNIASRSCQNIGGAWYLVAF